MTDRERILAVIEATGCFDQAVGKYAQGLVDGGMPGRRTPFSTRKGSSNDLPSP